MTLDFFSKDCQSEPITLESFGLCDRQDGTKAYPDTNIEHTDRNRIAEVENKQRLPVVFTAIDKCVLQDNDSIGQGRCDAMLTTDKHLYLVELKVAKENWQAKAIQQLKDTIKLLTANHDITPYKYKKAFACNRKHKKFNLIDNQINKQFFRETGFRLDIRAKIVII